MASCGRRNFPLVRCECTVLPGWALGPAASLPVGVAALHPCTSISLGAAGLPAFSPRFTLAASSAAASFASFSDYLCPESLPASELWPVAAPERDYRCLAAARPSVLAILPRARSSSMVTCTCCIDSVASEHLVCTMRPTEHAFGSYFAISSTCASFSSHASTGTTSSPPEIMPHRNQSSNAASRAIEAAVPRLLCRRHPELCSVNAAVALGCTVLQFSLCASNDNFPC